jgi:hypothetical protein
MNQRVLRAEFLDEITQRADTKFKGLLHQAFLDWYIEAEFGGVDWKFTDGPSDGGIDAVVWRPDDKPPVILIQSKFAEHIGATQLGASAYRDFKKVVEAFYHRGDEFDELLSRVLDGLKPVYRKALDRLEAVNFWPVEKKAFRLITTCNRRPNVEFDKIPKDNYLYSDDVLRLYAQHRKGATPRARPLELTLADKLSYRDTERCVTSYIFNARLSDFRRYLEHNDVARLVARNIRYNLGGSVGRNIRRTYEKNPVNFWYVHNGLTVVCDDFIEKDQMATLINPSVINGAQTLYAISASPRKTSKALVTTRVIVRGSHETEAIEDDEWLQGVIRGVNTQNRVHAYDFRSNEPEQIEIQKRLRDLKVFYERKRGEWREFASQPQFKGFDRLSLAELGQVLTVVSDKDGQGVLLAKRSLEDIFDEKHYRKLFPSKSKVARRFKNVYLAYRLYRLLRRVGYPLRNEFRKQRHAFWNTLWVLHRGITSANGSRRASLRGIREAFDRFEGRGMWGIRARKLVKQTRKLVWSAWRKARRSDPERWTPNNFFKSKVGNQKALAASLPSVRQGLQSLGRYIAGDR